MQNSRSKNVFLNVLVGYAAQLGILLLSFISRKIFVVFLSADYLGINGLYSNILSVLALAELGLGSVTQFYLYKPVAENDTNKIVSLFKFFKKIYLVIAASILCLGVALIPFLGYVVNSALPQTELIIYYVLFLVNSVTTYFSAPQIALLAANQDNRLHKLVTLLSNFVLQFAHIAVLMIWKNYVIYVFVTWLSTLLNVVILNMVCQKKYPYIKQKNLPIVVDKNGIVTSVKSTFVYKVGSVVVNNTTNILISILVSTYAVGLYSNYYMVISGVQGFIAIITTSLISSIGNLSASGNKQRLLSVFRTLLLSYGFVATVGGIGFCLLFNDLIEAWLGVEYLMSRAEVFAISFSFYLTTAISPIWMYREANGLFSKVKYLMIAMALVNIVASVILGKLFGVFGILLATPIAKILTQVWYEPHILFQNVFRESQKRYWLLMLKYISLTAISAVLCYLCTFKLPHSFLFMIVKAVIICAVCFAVFCIGNYRSNEFMELENMVAPVVNKFKKKMDS